METFRDVGKGGWSNGDGGRLFVWDYDNRRMGRYVSHLQGKYSVYNNGMALYT